MLCRPLRMVPVEAVARGYLTGSGLLDYRATGEVAAFRCPPGWSTAPGCPSRSSRPRRRPPLGEHDEHVAYDAVVATVGADTAAELRDITLRVYARGAELAGERGILLADTKLEFGRDDARHPGARRRGADPGLVAVLAGRRVGARPGPAVSFDKQYVRDWLTSPASGWDRAGGSRPPPLPDDVVAATRARYVEAYERLTGLRFADWPGRDAD